MSALRAREIPARGEWDALLRAMPNAHVLQTWEWGEFKRATGWQPLRLAFTRRSQVLALASLGMRRVGPFCALYAPRGPLLDWEDSVLVRDVLTQLEQIARRQRAIWLKIDPDLPVATGLPGGPDEQPHPAGQRLLAELRQRGWRFSDEQIQFRNTILLDLARSEDELLMAMSGSTRRKIRLAGRRGVSVRRATPADLDTLVALYRRTGARDGFLTRPAAYYRVAWSQFMAAGLARGLIAEYAGQALAHIILFHLGARCWYLYGASADEERQRMPNHALQWAAIRQMRALGCRSYDLWGAPDTFAESDPLWGVYMFKRGFRGQILRTVGAQDYRPYPALARAWGAAWPRLRRWRRALAAQGK